MIRIKNLELRIKNLARESRLSGRPQRQSDFTQHYFGWKQHEITRTKLTNSAGFTLIELAIYLGVLSILLLVLSSFFNSALDGLLNSQATSPTEQDSKFILNRLMYDITNADSLTTPVSPGDQGQTLQLVRNGITYTYTQTGGNLTISDNVGTDVLNSPQATISNLSFKRIGYTAEKPTVQIIFTVTSVTTAKSGKDTQNFQTTVSLR
jgi:type II secretory pathway pseudopilin PulG